MLRRKITRRLADQTSAWTHPERRHKVESSAQQRPGREPKSYQCSARMPSGPCSLSGGIFRSVVGTCSATSDKNKAEIGADAGAGGSGSAG